MKLDIKLLECMIFIECSDYLLIMKTIIKYVLANILHSIKCQFYKKKKTLLTLISNVHIKSHLN